ncbi:hypothetical protein APSETT444_010139 [Aspergillus pseudonomiae]
MATNSSTQEDSLQTSSPSPSPDPTSKQDDLDPPTTSATATAPPYSPIYATAEPARAGESGFLDNAKAWFWSAGNKLAEVEAEVWRRINEAHDK